MFHAVLSCGRGLAVVAYDEREKGKPGPRVRWDSQMFGKAMIREVVREPKAKIYCALTYCP